MHSNILSFACGVPFISIYYDIKSIEFLKLIDYSSFGCNGFEDYVEKIIPLIDKLIEHNYLYSNQFRRIKEENLPKFEQEISHICEIIKLSNDKCEQTPLLTVLMPVYNRENLIPASIESVLNQTLKNFEFLIYDDGSTDNTVNIIEQYMTTDSRIKLIKGQPNMGGIYAKQMLLNECRTKYAAWMDSDDIMLSDKLKTQLSFVFSNNIVFSKWLWLREDGENRWKLDYHTQKTLCLDSMMFLVDKTIKMPNTKLWGSSSWFNEMMNKYTTWIELQTVFYHIRQHNNRITLTKQKVKTLIKDHKLKEEDIQNITYQELLTLIKNLHE